MKRGGLFIIGLVSFIATIISLNVAFGRSGYYNERYPYYNRFHYHCDEKYNRDHHEKSKYDERNDSTTNY